MDDISDIPTGDVFRARLIVALESVRTEKGCARRIPFLRVASARNRMEADYRTSIFEEDCARQRR